MRALTGLQPPPKSESNVLHRYLGWWALAAIAAAAALVSFGLLKHSGRIIPEEPFQTMRLTRLTTSGKAKAAAISRDGKYVAYAFGDPEAQGLRVLQTATRSDLQILPAAEGQLRGLTFSEEGDYIFYVRFEKSDTYKATLYTVPALGGPPRKVATDVRSAATLSPIPKNGIATPFRDESRSVCE